VHHQVVPVGPSRWPRFSIQFRDLKFSVFVAIDAEYSGIALNNPRIVTLTLNFQYMCAGILGAPNRTGHFPVTDFCCNALCRKQNANYRSENRRMLSNSLLFSFAHQDTLHVEF